jgi:uncharacterized protein (TIGR02145 family)
MKIFLKLLLIFLLLVTNIFAQGPKEVKIGNKTWMSQNLNTEMFKNGDLIPQAKTYQEWNIASSNKQPSWCYYGFDPNNEFCGKLYNFYAVKDPRGIAPTGWHVATRDEWVELASVIGGQDVGKKIKSKSGWLNWKSGGEPLRCSNCSDWSSEYRAKVPCHVCKDTRRNGTTPVKENNGNGIDLFGFNVLPCGYLSDSFVTGGKGKETRFWTSTTPSYTNTMVYYRLLRNSSDYLFDDDSEYRENSLGRGYSVRCVKD